MKRLTWQTSLGLILILSSFVIYFFQIMIFNKSGDTFFYLFQDLAFLPIEVLLVTLIINRVLKEREKTAMLQKLNMVIGAFFSEVGTDLLRSFSEFDVNCEEFRNNFKITGKWCSNDFICVKEKFKNYNYKIVSRKGDLDSLRTFLGIKRNFLVNLLENSNLLEHESFTDLLWAVFHITEELTYRKNVTHLSDADYKHIGDDIKRAYILLIAEWLDYMEHLKEKYPYLFSLAIRMNPFDPNASPELK